MQLIDGLESFKTVCAQILRQIAVQLSPVAFCGSAFAIEFGRRGRSGRLFDLWWRQIFVKALRLRGWPAAGATFDNLDNPNGAGLGKCQNIPRTNRVRRFRDFQRVHTHMPARHGLGAKRSRFEKARLPKRFIKPDFVAHATRRIRISPSAPSKRPRTGYLDRSCQICWAWPNRSWRP